MRAHEIVRAIDRAHSLLDEGQADRAHALLDRALSAREGADPLDVAQALGLDAVALRDLGELAEAQVRFAEARALLAPRHDVDARRALGALLEDLAELELEQRRPDSARTLLSEAIDAQRAAGDAIEPETWLALAEAQLGCDANDDALEAATRAAEGADATGDDESSALARELAADARMAEGDDDGARTRYQDALARWRALGDDEGTARARLALARLDERRDDGDAVLAQGRAIAELAGLDDEVRAEVLGEIRELLASLGRDPEL